VRSEWSGLVRSGDEEGTLKRLRKLRRELINPAASLHRGRIRRSPPTRPGELRHSQTSRRGVATVKLLEELK
jgi:hypothetical protein